MRSLSAPFILRPIATALLALAVLLGGLLGYRGLPVAPLPQVDFPTIQVSTALPGANAETMSALVTAPLERQLGQIPSLSTLVSSSAFGLSRITLQFALDRAIDGAAQDVQAAINAAGSTLPRTLPYPPTYAKVNPADSPILTLALRSDTVPIRTLSDLADTLLAQRLAEVSGVGHVNVQGGVRPAIRVQVDLARLASYGLGLEDVRTAVTASSVAGPKGSLDGSQQSYTIAVNDQIEAAAGYGRIVLAVRNGAPVHLADVADLVSGLENDRVGAWYQGRPAVVLDVLRQPGANVIGTVAGLKAALPGLERTLPAGVHLDVVSDRTATIQASIHDVELTLALSVGLVILVVLVFLRTLRATLIAAVALPLSLIATFGVMWLAGFSLDNLSLMALTIGTGFVVDDAIVMIENIVRHIEEGERPFEAALSGAREIGFTVVSLTVSLVAVFIPLLFMSGIVGRMFREFALTLTIAVVASMVVSLTLTPMMASLLLRADPAAASPARGPGRLRRGLDAALDGTLALYRRSLVWALDREPLMLLVSVLTLAATITLYVVIPKGFLPPQDTGLVTATVSGEPTASFDAMRRLQADVAARVGRNPAVEGVVSVIGAGSASLTSNTGALTLVLHPRDQRGLDAQGVIRRLEGLVAGIPGASVVFQSVQDIQITARTGQAAYQYTLTGTGQDDVGRWALLLAERLGVNSLMRNVSAEGQGGGARLAVTVDRDAASRLGVSMQAVTDTFNDAFGQRQVATIYAQANQYRVILEASPRDQAGSGALDRLYVAGTDGAQVPLGAIASVRRTTAPMVIEHDEQFPAVTVSFDLASGASLGDAVAAVTQAAVEIGQPPEIVGRYSGDAAEFASSLANEPWLILAAVVTIYIVLGVLYESAIHPVTILSTLPSAGVGALLALMATGLDLSLIGLIGIILLMGIVKKNAIMMIDFALEAERVRGLAPREAILQASLLRFRPIMMTTLAALFGALPLALGRGTGSELRIPLGVSIVGGLLLSQLLTLYTTPVIYLALERLRLRLSGRREGAVAEPAAIGHGAAE